MLGRKGRRCRSHTSRTFWTARPNSMRSSMLKDLIAGRPLELDGIGGPILRAGEKHGISVPTTRKLMDTIEREAQRSNFVNGTTSELLRRNPLRAHVWPQNLRDDHAAVGLLIILDNRHPRASDRQTAAVQRVHQLRLLRRLQGDSGYWLAAPGNPEVRARRNLAKELLPRQPNFQVVGLGRRRPQVAVLKAPSRDSAGRASAAPLPRCASASRALPATAPVW